MNNPEVLEPEMDFQDHCGGESPALWRKIETVIGNVLTLFIWKERTGDEKNSIAVYSGRAVIWLQLNLCLMLTINKRMHGKSDFYRQNQQEQEYPWTRVPPKYLHQCISRLPYFAMDDVIAPISSNLRRQSMPSAGIYRPSYRRTETGLNLVRILWGCSTQWWKRKTPGTVATKIFC